MTTATDTQKPTTPGQVTPVVQVLGDALCVTSIGFKIIEAENAKLRAQLAECREALEEIVCPEGADSGLLLKDYESPTKFDSKRGCHVYDHEHFSEMGDALVALWKMMEPVT